jgi:hypothetical protein
LQNLARSISVAPQFVQNIETPWKCT